jgi:hypothetical protein
MMLLSHSLRDLTTESESEMKRKVESLEKELDLSADLQGSSFLPFLPFLPHPDSSSTHSRPRQHVRRARRG